jgi:2'-5' RNA ligase
MRLFVAIDLEDAVRERLALFVEGVRGFAPDVNWVRPESFHLTLKFIGERPPESFPAIQQALAAVQAPACELRIAGIGFFPTASMARVFWAGVATSPPLKQLANTVDGVLAAAGVPRESHAFSPHLTLARARRSSGAPQRRQGDAPSRAFARLQEKLSTHAPPEFGRMTAREFFLYQSRTSPGGAQYAKMARFPLL